VDLLGEFQQLQFATLVADGGEGADQFPDPGAVNVGDIGQVEQDLIFAFADQVADGVPQYDAAFPKGYTSAQVNDGHSTHLPVACFHGHLISSLALAASRPTCLIKVISVPGSSFLIFTSSIKARIRNMPRPDWRIRFSGASGSEMHCGSSPLPWSVMVMTRESGVISYTTNTFFRGS